MYRREPQSQWLQQLRRRLTGEEDEQRAPRYRRRNKITMRIYRDVPMPTWKLVFPDKLLQFRPLDGLRADLLSVAGQQHAWLQAPDAHAGAGRRVLSKSGKLCRAQSAGLQVLSPSLPRPNMTLSSWSSSRCPLLSFSSYVSF